MVITKKKTYNTFKNNNKGERTKYITTKKIISQRKTAREEQKSYKTDRKQPTKWQ